MQLLCSFNFCNFLVASMHGNVEVAKILIENGADLNKKDKIKKSSLMVRLYIKFVKNAQNVISCQFIEKSRKHLLQFYTAIHYADHQ